MLELSLKVFYLVLSNTLVTNKMSKNYNCEIITETDDTKPYDETVTRSHNWCYHNKTLLRSDNKKCDGPICVRTQRYLYPSKIPKGEEGDYNYSNYTKKTDTVQTSGGSAGSVFAITVFILLTLASLTAGFAVIYIFRNRKSALYGGILITGGIVFLIVAIILIKSTRGTSKTTETVERN